jgi:predicted amidohydrolase
MSETSRASRAGGIDRQPADRRSDGAGQSPADLVLVAVQVRLAAHHLESPGRFRALVDRLGEQAAAAGGPHRLWVFPEAVGYFLPLAFAPPDALARDTLAGAFTTLAVRRPLALVRGLLEARGGGLRRGLLHAYLPACDRLMRESFAALARRHRAWVVAGSHLRGHADGRVTASSYTFDPAGRLAAVTDKVNLVPGLEDGAPGGLGLSRGDAERLPLVRAPWGTLATLIGYDGFAEPQSDGERFAWMAGRADAAGADVVANPAASPAEAWPVTGLAESLERVGHLRHAVTAQLCGAVLDRSFAGRSAILTRGQDGVHVLAAAAGPTDAEVVSARVRLTAAATGVTG